MGSKPITQRAKCNYTRMPGQPEVTVDAAGKQRANFPSTSPRGIGKQLSTGFDPKAAQEVNMKAIESRGALLMEGAGNAYKTDIASANVLQNFDEIGGENEGEANVTPISREQRRGRRAEAKYDRQQKRNKRKEAKNNKKIAKSGGFSI